jgi:hypothetical protein
MADLPFPPNDVLVEPIIIEWLAQHPAAKEQRVLSVHGSTVGEERLR